MKLEASSRLITSAVSQDLLLLRSLPWVAQVVRKDLATAQTLYVVFVRDTQTLGQLKARTAELKNLFGARTQFVTPAQVDGRPCFELQLSDLGLV